MKYIWIVLMCFNYLAFSQYYHSRIKLNKSEYDSITRWDALVDQYERTQELDKRIEYNRKQFYITGCDPAAGHYFYNLLNGLAPNAILITKNSYEKFNIWELQDVFHHRRDVTILDLEMLQDEAYRSKIFNKLKITPAEAEIKDLKTSSDIDKILVDFLIKHCQNRPLYFSISLGDQDYFKPYEANMYIVGLAKMYSTKKVDNMALLRDNFENKYLLDYLEMPLYIDPDSTGVVYPFGERTYLPSLILLYNHYKASGETSKLPKTRNLIVKVAKGDGQFDWVKKIIE